MQDYKKEFIEFMLNSDVLTFGEFTTKSGRKTPYFINTGNYKTGLQIDKLGEFYAKTIIDNYGDNFDILYGPAYKGIPIVVSTAAALMRLYRINKGFCFNRKEVKDHGEGGIFVGQKPQNGDKILILEDVTTAGTSIRENVPLLKDFADVEIIGLTVSVDRMEKGKSNKGALGELSEEFGFKAVSIVNIEEIVTYLYNKEINGKIVIDDNIMKRIILYREKYGVKN